MFHLNTRCKFNRSAFILLSFFCIHNKLLAQDYHVRQLFRAMDTTNYDSIICTLNGISAECPYFYPISKWRHHLRATEVEVLDSVKLDFLQSGPLVDSASLYLHRIWARRNIFSRKFTFYMVQGESLNLDIIRGKNYFILNRTREFNIISYMFFVEDKAANKYGLQKDILIPNE